MIASEAQLRRSELADRVATPFFWGAILAVLLTSGYITATYGQGEGLCCERIAFDSYLCSLTTKTCTDRLIVRKLQRYDLDKSRGKSSDFRATHFPGAKKPI